MNSHNDTAFTAPKGYSHTSTYIVLTKYLSIYLSINKPYHSQ